MFEWILLIALILNATASFVWARRYRDAKNAEIKTKDAQIELLKTQVDFLEQRRPKALEEDHESMKRMYEDYVERLERQVADRSAEIKRLEAEDQAKEGQASRSIQGLRRQVANLKAELASGDLPSTWTVLDSLSSSAEVAIATGTPRPVSDEDAKSLIESTASAGTVIKASTKSRIIKPPS